MRAWTALPAMLALAACVQAPGGAPLNQCDVLAQPPLSASSVAPLRPPGVPLAQMDAPAAEAACRAAMAEYPAEPRFRCQLGLAMQRQRLEVSAETACRQAAELGYAPAAFQLGTRALLRPTRSSAERDAAWAQHSLATRYFNGTGVAKDGAEAQSRLAVAQGDPDALNNLGMMDDAGRAVPRDTAEAVRLFRLSAEAGTPEAQTNLAIMLANGRGVAKDEAEAERLWRLAARQGNITAQQRLRSRGMAPPW